MSRQRITDVRSLFDSMPQLRILSRLWSDMRLQGAYRSAFRGVGLAFKDIREYEPGDDYRRMDWNSLARTGEPHTKRFEEERELSVVFALDCSESMEFGARNRTKKELAALAAAAVAFNAVRQGDKVGAFLFGPGFERFLPLGSGLSHALAVIDAYLKTPAGAGRTDYSRIVGVLRRAYKRRAVVFWGSDFLDERPDARSAAAVARRHDLIPVIVRDPLEVELPSVGIITVGDPDGGSLREAAPFALDASDPALRARYKRMMAEHDRELTSFFRSIGAEPLRLRTDEPLLTALNRYMLRRAGRGTPAGVAARGGGAG